MDTAPKPAKEWLLDIQRKLYQWSQNHREEAYHDLWNWITDSRNLELAWARVASNKGRNTPGTDGVTVSGILSSKGGLHSFLESVREKLRTGQYSPSPVREKLIPKAGKPGATRALGIPTVEDRVVQSAILQIIEPIFEARFYHVSMGFRPGRAVRDAIELIRRTARCMSKDESGRKINPPYKWIIEGDIKACFDKIDHHALMSRVRKGVDDKKVTRLITAFLKAGIMAGNEYRHSSQGTPQGGILSPLLANIALSVIEERYTRWVYPRIGDRGHHLKSPLYSATSYRRQDRLKGRPVFYPVRYADDFILIAAGTESEIIAEKNALAEMLNQELGLELSEEKTKITTLENGFFFLGHHIRLRENERWGYVLQALVPLERQQRQRRKIKTIVRQTSKNVTLSKLLKRLNPIIRGWGNFYRHTNGCYSTFKKMDYYIFMCVFRWLRKKFHTKRWNLLYRKFRGQPRDGNLKRWMDEDVECFQLSDLKRERWDLRFTGQPDYAIIVGEPGA